jgi:putative nucleotidyltransferase with HDIG domain
VAGAFALAGVRRRSALLKAGMVASLAAMGSATAFTLLIPGGGGLREWGEALLFSGGSGILSAAFTLGFLPYFEAVFGILSPLRLVELGNPNHPLLRKLLTEAPGTYHHSILVANLAESAAEAIGADGLLARIGAYYHDVGKIRRPRFFIENQMGRSNPHDKLSPHLSRTIILSHPADGVEILEQYRIPKPIRDIAAQHHGTTLLKYFYHKALKQKCGSQVREADFRYPGPKAQFKEAAIVGICDSAEAAVRALARPTPERIEALVKKIIQERLEDGQFDECDLTLKELDAIARIVTETLVGMFHTRLEYPEEATVKGVKQA